MEFRGQSLNTVAVLGFVKSSRLHGRVNKVLSINYVKYRASGERERHDEKYELSSSHGTHCVQHSWWEEKFCENKA